MKSDCTFCKIINKEIPADIFYEDSDSVAFLDINPAMKGQAVVMPKIHTGSDFKLSEDKILSKTIISAKKAAQKLDKTFGTRCCLVIEGFDIDHLHFKLYPTTPEKHLKIKPQKPANKKELKKLAEKIRIDS